MEISQQKILRGMDSPTSAHRRPLRRRLISMLVISRHWFHCAGTAGNLLDCCTETKQIFCIFFGITWEKQNSKFETIYKWKLEFCVFLYVYPISSYILLLHSKFHLQGSGLVGALRSDAPQRRKWIQVVWRWMEIFGARKGLLVDVGSIIWRWTRVLHSFTISSLITFQYWTNVIFKGLWKDFCQWDGAKDEFVHTTEHDEFLSWVRLEPILVQKVSMFSPCFPHVFHDSMTSCETHGTTWAQKLPLPQLDRDPLCFLWFPVFLVRTLYPSSNLNGVLATFIVS